MLKKNSQNWIKFGMVDEKIHKHETTWDVQWSFIAFGCVCSFFSSFVCLFITYALQTGKHRFLVLNRRSVPCKCVRSSTVSCCYARLKGQMLISTECIWFHYRLSCFNAADTQMKAQWISSTKRNKIKKEKKIATRTSSESHYTNNKRALYATMKEYRVHRRTHTVFNLSCLLHFMPIEMVDALPRLLLLLLTLFFIAIYLNGITYHLEWNWKRMKNTKETAHNRE